MDREILVVFGPSGNGKTMLLRCIAGLEKVEEGYIEVDGEVWLDTEKGINIAPNRRNLGFVFQDYALFPNMTVYENVAYAMREKDHKRVMELLQMAELLALKDVYPDRLSGGQKQRLALIRALARGPKLLLLDEPFSSLDWELKNRLRMELKNFQRSLNIPTLLISHDLEDLITLADRGLRLKEGKLIAHISKQTLQSLITSARIESTQCVGDLCLMDVKMDKNKLTVLTMMDSKPKEVKLYHMAFLSFQEGERV